jgi:hypothetical protein
MTASLASAKSVFSGAKPFLNFVGDGKDVGGILGVAGIELIRLLLDGSDHPQPGFIQDVEIALHHARRSQGGKLGNVDQIVEHRAQRGLSIEDGNVDEGHSGHVRGIGDDARPTRSNAIVERWVRNGFTGLRDIKDSHIPKQGRGKKGSECSDLSGAEGNGRRPIFLALLLQPGNSLGNQAHQFRLGKLCRFHRYHYLTGRGSRVRSFPIGD